MAKKKAVVKKPSTKKPPPREGGVGRQPVQQPSTRRTVGQPVDPDEDD
jgi:hypothetical protein